MYGGNIGQGILTGAEYGALSGAVFGAIGAYYGDSWSLGRVATYGLAGGGVAELGGGDFRDGAIYALTIIALAAYEFVGGVGEEPKATPGEKLVTKEAGERSYQGNQNTGKAVRPGETDIKWYHEHHPFMGALNRGPLMSAFSTYHDNLPINYNIPESVWYKGVAYGASHVYALGLTYAAYAATTCPSVHLNIYLNDYR